MCSCWACRKEKSEREKEKKIGDMRESAELRRRRQRERNVGYFNFRNMKFRKAMRFICHLQKQVFRKEAWPDPQKQQA